MSIISFLIAKAHASHSKSPNEAQMNGMITADRITDVESILSTTGYGPLLNEVRPSVDLPQFEITLRRDYANLLRIYRNAAKGKVKKLLEAYTLTIEAENMDMIFQAIIRDNVDEDLEQIIIPVGKFGLQHYQRIMDNSDAEVATDFIIYPQLRRAAQIALNKSDDPDEQIFLLSSAFSHTAYTVMSEIAPDWIKLEVDFLNLETICRAINLDISAEQWLIPDIGSVWRHRNQLMNLSNPKDALSYMQSRMSVSRPIQQSIDADDPVVKFEDEVLQYLYYHRYRNFMLYGNRLEAILDFFSIKRAEIEDISRVLTSKILTKTTTHDLRRMVYPIYH